jgi:hypothetical protein
VAAYVFTAKPASGGTAVRVRALAPLPEGPHDTLDGIQGKPPRAAGVTLLFMTSKARGRRPGAAVRFRP